MKLLILFCKTIFNLFSKIKCIAPALPNYKTYSIGYDKCRKRSFSTVEYKFLRTIINMHCFICRVRITYLLKILTIYSEQLKIFFVVFHSQSQFKYMLTIRLHYVFSSKLYLELLLNYFIYE